MADEKTAAQLVLDRATATITTLEHAGDALKTALNTTTALARSLANDPAALVAAMDEADLRANDWVKAVGANTDTPLPEPTTPPDVATPVDPEPAPSPAPESPPETPPSDPSSEAA